MDNKVAIYLRKSRADEKADALANHRAVLIRLAESKGFEYDVYDEIGSSVSLEWRTELDRMLKNLHEYSHVLVMDIDRLARNLAAMETIKERLRYNNVKILTPNQEIDLNVNASELMMDMQSVIAKNEYLTIAKRLSIGKVEGARKGHWVNGVAPLGYSYIKAQRKLVVNETEFPLVREIFSLALKNMSYMEIAINLNLRGFTTRQGNDFSQASIKAILTNRAYVGDVVYRKKSKIRGVPDEVIVSHNCHTAIVSESEWLEVQKLIKNRRTNVGKVTTVVRSAIQGLIYCGCCGAKLTVTVHKGGELYIKNCWRVDSKGIRCPNRSHKVKTVEEAVVAEIMKYREQAVKEAMDLLNVDNTAKRQQLQDKIKSIKESINSAEAVIERLLEGYLTKVISESIYVKKQKEKEAALSVLKDDLRSAELDLEGLDSEVHVHQLKEVIRMIDNYGVLDVQQANRFISRLVKSVTITVLPDESSVYRRAKSEATVVIEFNEGIK